MFMSRADDISAFGSVILSSFLEAAGALSKHPWPLQVNRLQSWGPEVGVSENRGPYYGTLTSRILMIKTPKYGTPNFRKLPK